MIWALNWTEWYANSLNVSDLIDKIRDFYFIEEVCVLVDIMTTTTMTKYHLNYHKALYLYDSDPFSPSSLVFLNVNHTCRQGTHSSAYWSHKH